MKKKITFFLIVLLIAMCTTTVFAASKEELLQKLESTYTVAGKTRTLSAGEKVQVERYLATHEVTAEQADVIISKIDETANYINSTGVAEISKMTEEQRNKALSIMSEGANVIGLKVSYSTDDKEIVVSDSTGSTIMATDLNGSNGKLNTTGGSNVSYIAIPVLSIIVLVAIERKIRK